MLLKKALIFGALSVGGSCGNVRNIFSFGDSYTHTQWAIHTPTLACPMGIAGACLEGRTYAGGHNWLTSAMMLYNHTQNLVNNFARAGYVSDSNYVLNKKNGGIKQPDVYGEYHDFKTVIPNTKWKASNSLFSFFIGINDIRLTISSFDQNVCNKFLDSYFNTAEQIYQLGGRQFYFSNVPPFYHASTMSDATLKQYSQAVYIYNTLLLERVQAFKKKHDDIRHWFFDAFTAYYKVLNAPEQYGFQKDGGKPGCKVANGPCFWYDGLHPSSKAHMIFGKQIADILGAWGSD